MHSLLDERLKKVIDDVDALRDKVDDHWQIPRDEANVLLTLALACRSRSVCEIGTSYGFSTLHLAAAMRANGGHVHTFDISEKKNQAARKHLTEAGLIDHVSLHLGDARETVRAIEPAHPYDFVFIDATKEQSFGYLESVWLRLSPRAVLLTDNTTTHATQLAEFVSHLRGHDELVSCGVTVGNGFEMSVLMRD